MATGAKQAYWFERRALLWYIRSLWHALTEMKYFRVYSVQAFCRTTELESKRVSGENTQGSVYFRKPLCYSDQISNLYTNH